MVQGNLFPTSNYKWYDIQNWNLPACLSFVMQDKFACSTIIYLHSNRNLHEIIKLSSNIWSFLFLQHKFEWKKYTCNCNLESVQWAWKEWNFTLNMKICSTFFLLLEICLHHYHLWCRANLPAPLSSMVQGNLSAPQSFMVQGKFTSHY